MAYIGDVLIELYIKDARAGDPEAARQVLAYAKDFLNGELSQQHDMHAVLRDYLAEAFAAIVDDGQDANRALYLRKRKGNQSAASNYETVGRDIDIAQAVLDLNRAGVPLTGNADEDGAFFRIGEECGLKEDQVRKIYYRWKDRLLENERLNREG